MRIQQNKRNRFIDYALQHLSKSSGDRGKVTLTVQGDDYYGCSVTVLHKLSENNYEILASNCKEFSQRLKAGETYKVDFVYYDEGFENPKWTVGNQLVQGNSTGDFILSEQTDTVIYKLDLKDGYGIVYLEIWPEDMKELGVTVDCYLADANTYTERESIPDNAWTELFTGCSDWKTKTVKLTDDENNNLSYWVCCYLNPIIDKYGEDCEPYIGYWQESTGVLQSWGGGYAWVYKTQLGLDEITQKSQISLSATLVSEETRKNKYCRVKILGVKEEDGELIDFATSKQLIKGHDDTTWESMIQHNPKTWQELDSSIITKRIDVEHGCPDGYEVIDTFLNQEALDLGVQVMETQDEYSITGITLNAADKEIVLTLKYSSAHVHAPNISAFNVGVRTVNGTCKTKGATIHATVTSTDGETTTVTNYITTVDEDGNWEIDLSELIIYGDIISVYAVNDGETSETVTKEAEGQLGGLEFKRCYVLDDETLAIEPNLIVGWTEQELPEGEELSIKLEIYDEVSREPKETITYTGIDKDQCLYSITYELETDEVVKAILYKTSSESPIFWSGKEVPIIAPPLVRSEITTEDAEVGGFSYYPGSTVYCTYYDISEGTSYTLSTTVEEDANWLIDFRQQIEAEDGDYYEVWVQYDEGHASKKITYYTQVIVYAPVITSYDVSRTTISGTCQSESAVVHVTINGSGTEYTATVVNNSWNITIPTIVTGDVASAYAAKYGYNSTTVTKEAHIPEDLHFIVKKQDNPGGTLSIGGAPTLISSSQASVGYGFDMHVTDSIGWTTAENDTYDAVLFYLDESCTQPAKCIYDSSTGIYYSGLSTIAACSYLSDYPARGEIANNAPSEEIPYLSTLYIKWINTTACPQVPTITNYTVNTNTISGTCETTGATISASVNGGEIKTTTVSASNEWSITLDNTIANEDTVTVYAENNGYRSSISTATTPCDPIITSFEVGMNTVSGTCQTNNTVVYVKINDGEYQDTSVTDNSWHISLSNTIVSGDTVSAYATYGVGQSATVSTSIPYAPVITSFVIDNNIISGTCGTTGATISVSINSGVVKTATVSASNEWSVTLDDIIEDGDTATTYATKDGKNSALTIARIPHTPVITALDGVSNSLDNVTIEGTCCPAGATIHILTPTFHQEFTATVDGYEEWSAAIGTRDYVKGGDIITVYAELNGCVSSQVTIQMMDEPVVTSYISDQYVIGGTHNVPGAQIQITMNWHTFLTTVDENGNWRRNDCDSRVLGIFAQEVTTDTRRTSHRIVPTQVTRDEYPIGGSFVQKDYTGYHISDSDNVTKINACTFALSGNLKELMLPASIIEIENQAFAYCNNFKNLYITNADAVITLETNIFMDITPSPTIYVPENLLTNYQDRYTQYTFVALPSDFSITKYEAELGVPNQEEYPTGGSRVDRTCTGYTIPDSVTSLGVYCFYDCTSLTNITIPDSVTSLGSSCFYCCTSLTSITIPASVTSLGSSCFTFCTSLTTVRIERTADIVTLGTNGFAGCRVLTTIYVPNTLVNSYKAAANWSPYSDKIVGY